MWQKLPMERNLGSSAQLRIQWQNKTPIVFVKYGVSAHFFGYMGGEFLIKLI